MVYSGRLLSANALLDDAFAAALSESTYEWEAALQLAEAAATSPAVLTGLQCQCWAFAVTNHCQHLSIFASESSDQPA